MEIVFSTKSERLKLGLPKLLFSSETQVFDQNRSNFYVKWPNDSNIALFGVKCLLRHIPTPKKQSVQNAYWVEIRKI